MSGPSRGENWDLGWLVGWFRVESVFNECEKVCLLETQLPRSFEQAITYWLYCGLYCARNSTDGFIPERQTLRMVPTIQRPKRIVDALVECGLLSRVDGGLTMHDYLDYNPSKVDKERWREQGRARQATFREKQKGNAAVTEQSNAVTNTLPSSVSNANPVLSLPVPTNNSPDPDGPCISELECRYPTDIVDTAREACALSRKTGTMADSVWLRTLQKLDKYDQRAVVTAMTTMAEKYADGEKSEAYMIAIARNENKKYNNGTPRQVKSQKQRNADILEIR